MSNPTAAHSPFYVLMHDLRYKLEADLRRYDVPQDQKEYLADLHRHIVDLELYGKDRRWSPAELTRHAHILSMTIGGESMENPHPIRWFTIQIFMHYAYDGQHKALWKRMIRLITKERRDDVKRRLKIWGWHI